MEQHIQTAPFVEMIVIKPTQSSNSDFDIILNDKVTLQNYCDALIDKIFQLTQSEFPAFINYQCSLVNEPIVWLNKLEKLITNNEALFTGKCALSRYNKLFYLIELKRKEVQSSSVKDPKAHIPKKHINAENEDRYFSFYELKKQLDKTPCDKQKILLLTKERHDYKQSNIEFINLKIPLFDKQCTKEIDQINELGKLKFELEKANTNKCNCQKQINKIQFNCNVNQFVDIYYQLHRELFSNGKPIIDGNINDMVAMIVNSFVDKDGNEISPQTVETILKPSRGDKRPKPHKRLDIDKLL
ncbi:hypothetical protein [Flavobacterium aestuarii]|uniref:hypothetical protein n=1 Tax=Flavobacterium aestuarii TaxID=3149227 RepID=UPI0032B5EAA4